MLWHWQYLVPPLILILNVDWVLMPIIKGWGIDSLTLFIGTSILAVTELICCYWFWKWFRKTSLVEFAHRAKKRKEVQEAIALGKEIEFDLKMAGLLDEIKAKILNYIFNSYEKATDENNRLMRWTKRSGTGAMIILGVSPEPGTRTFGAIVCGVTGWKKGLYPLALGNILRVAYMVGLWQVIFSLF